MLQEEIVFRELLFISIRLRLLLIVEHETTCLNFLSQNPRLI